MTFTRFSSVCAMLLLGGAALPLGAQSYTFQTFEVPVKGTTKVSTFAQGINNRGEVAGYDQYIVRKRTLTEGFRRYSNGQFAAPIVDPEAYPGETFAQGINDSHEIVGYYIEQSGSTHGFLDNLGNFTTFDAPGSTLTAIQSITDSGKLAGYFSDLSGTYHGFTSISGVFSQVDVPGSSATQVWGMDEAEATAGCAGFQGVGPRAFIHETTGIGYTVFKVGKSEDVCATGINSKLGLAVGWAHESNGIYVGFVLHYRAFGSEPDPKTGQVSVTTVVYPGSKETLLYGINFAGQIVGSAIEPTSGQQIGFIATPVAAPAPGN